VLNHSVQPDFSGSALYPPPVDNPPMEGCSPTVGKCRLSRLYHCLISFATAERATIEAMRFDTGILLRLGD
jgi:hypothetical protein